jgi:NAD(P)-dependent dehydrogenase (short-subunit alcohol dehydrogenase family)
MPGTAAYAATKAALRAIVRVAATELASRKVRVNAISPGPIDTPILGKSGLPAEAIADFRSGVASRVPLARLGTPDEVASAAVFLASDESSFISGSEIAVDGGFAQV